MNAAPRRRSIVEKDDEDGLHRTIVQYLKMIPAKGLIWFHCPNGEYRSKATGAKLQAMGVRPGVADLCFTLPGGQSAYLELKRVGGRQSVEQRVFQADCERAGCAYAVAHTIEEAVTVLLSWGALRSNPLRRAA